MVDISAYILFSFVRLKSLPHCSIVLFIVTTARDVTLEFINLSETLLLFLVLQIYGELKQPLTLAMYDTLLRAYPRQTRPYFRGGAPFCARPKLIPIAAVKRAIAIVKRFT